MSIVLSVLQVIGWILLAVLLLVAAVLLIVLFCPVQYLIEGEFLEEKWAKLHVHWLLHLIRAKVSYGDDLIYGEVHAFWKKMTFSYDLTKKEEPDDFHEDELEEALRSLEDDEDEEESFDQECGTEELKEVFTKDENALRDAKDAVSDKKEENAFGDIEEVFSDGIEENSVSDKKKIYSEEAEEKEISAQLSDSKEKVIGTESAEELRGEISDSVNAENMSDMKNQEGLQDNSENNKSEKKSNDSENTDNQEMEEDFSDEEELLTEEKESIISKIKGIIERIKEVYPKMKMILNDEKNHAAVKHLKDEVVYLIKIFLPKKSKIDVVFSTGSPDTTGQLFGILACFPAMYQQDWKLLPDFEADEPYVKGTFWAKGRLAAYQFVGIVLRILFDKNCRRLYTMINKFFKWLKKDDKSQEEK